MLIVNLCPMCLTNEEKVDHLLLNCLTAQVIWRTALNWFDCGWVRPCSLKDLFKAWKMAVGSQRGKALWRSFLAIIWNTWKERNAGSFDGKPSSIDSLVGNVKFSAATFFGVFLSTRFQGISMN